MGLCGTELAKMASDIVILDDNFQSIVSALKWGRCVYDNVRGFLQLQQTVNLAAMFIAFVGSCVLKESPLKTIQLLWVNLIMDSLGALALATRSPSDALLLRPPYGESDGLISNVLVRNITGHVVYQMAVLLIVMFGADRLFGIDKAASYIREFAKELIPHTDLVDADEKPITEEALNILIDKQTDKATRRYVSTFVFNTFVYMQVFNLINARVAGQDMSVLDGIISNPFFIIIFLIIGGMQAILSEFAGAAFMTYKMQPVHWGIAIGFGVGSLLIGFILRLIRLQDHTSEKLQALRKIRADQIKNYYQGVPAPQQWEMSSLEGPAPVHPGLDDALV
jgi:Ca2+-transporting ATPase